MIGKLNHVGVATPSIEESWKLYRDVLGVTDIHIDRVRGVGNAAKRLPSTAELCGNCARGRAAVMPDGQVTPCVLGRFLPAGSVKEQGLEQVLTGDRWAEVAASIPPRAASCTPADSNDCDPSRTPACAPKYDE